MELARHVDALRGDLAASAAGAAPEVTRAAELLAAALEPAARLRFLELLSAAAAEVTASLPRGSVEVRLRGREPELLVVADPAPAPAGASDDGTTRLTLRLPETVKLAVEESAAIAGSSVNAWLVRAVADALDTPPPPGRRRITGFAHG